MNQVAINESEPNSPPAIHEPSSLLAAILHVARDPQLDVGKLEALMRMQFELEKRQAEKEAIEAFARLSATMPRVKKTGVIELGRDRDGKARGAIPFAKWDEIDKVIRPLLAVEGFTLSFNSTARTGEGGGLIVTGELMHRGGHVRTATIPLPLDAGPGRNNLQAMGSTLSYGKRYCAEMLLNIVREGDDDDGNKGGMAFLTPEMVEELQRLITETVTDEQRYLNLLGYAHLGEIPQSAFITAKNLLLQKRKTKS